MSKTQDQIIERSARRLQDVAAQIEMLDDVIAKALLARILSDNFQTQEINNLINDAEKNYQKIKTGLQ